MVTRRRKMKDLLTPDPTPDKQLAHKSGWCMTSDHKGCKYQFSHGKCGCDCHLPPSVVKAKAKAVVDDSTQETQKSSEPVVSIVPKRRGRPPKTSIVMPEKATVSSTTDPRPWKR
jgi:hypothetical protein